MSLVSYFRDRVPEGKHELIIPDATGHTTMTWGADTASVAEVRQEFDRIIRLGYTAYAESATGELSVTREFDETAARIVVSAPLVGG